MSRSNFSLDGRTALVTGGGRGIGLGIAVALAEAGADVVVADYTRELAEEGASAVSAAGRKALAVQVDVKVPQSVDAMLDTAVREFGGLDIAVNNAGVVSLGGIADLTYEQWNEVIDVNLRGAFLCCKAEIAHMRKAGYGRIVNMASIAGKVGFPNLSHYSASKFRVIGLGV